MTIDLTTAPSVLDLAAAAVRLLKLLTDPTRRHLFLLLMQGETCNCELVVSMANLPDAVEEVRLRE